MRAIEPVNSKRPSKQTRLNPQQLTPATYKTLVSKISRELSELEFFIKSRTAETYWKIGKFIHEHLLENKERADYGIRLFELLAEDVDRDSSTLQKMLRFYRAYPILAARPELTWEHYKGLMTVKDEKERKKLEEKIIQHDWDTRKLRRYLNIKRQLEHSANEDKPVPQLKFSRGRLDVRSLVNVPAGTETHSHASLRLDLGFRIRIEFPQDKVSNFKEGDYVEMTQKDGDWNFQKVEVSKDELFTYKAEVVKVIDGDTLTVNIDAGFGIFVEQKLRLRGIDCPEIDTEEGKKAKRFVLARLKDLEFIIIKTHKDSTDKYDRYLADIFYQDGCYLNQELLNERLAVVYE